MKAKNRDFPPKNVENVGALAKNLDFPPKMWKSGKCGGIGEKWRFSTKKVENVEKVGIFVKVADFPPKKWGFWKKILENF